MRHISFHADAWQDYLYWYQTSKSTFKKINELIRDYPAQPVYRAWQTRSSET